MATPSAATSEGLQPGLKDPVFDSQSIFRVLLEAMAHPGRDYAVPVKTTSVGGVSAEALAVLLSLADAETPVWLHESYRNPAVAQHLAFHASVTLTEETSAATFAVLPGGPFERTLPAFAYGTPEYPDRSTTLIICCESFEGDPALVLQGPGIETQQIFAPHPLPAGLRDQMAANTLLYPLGIDMIFVAPGRLAAIPRTTQPVTKGN